MAEKQMAVDMFLKIADIEGESKDIKHANEMQIENFTWGAAQSGTSAHGTGAGAGKVNIHDLHVTKNYDAASPKLFLSCANGKHHSSAEIVVRKAGENPLEYLKIKMTDVIITSIQTDGNNGMDTLRESIALNFTQVELEYTPQDEKGAGKGAVKAGWNVKTNQKV
jgi:type VI secretion system secreted protein Hcp